MDSVCSRHMTRSSKWFSSLDPMIGKEYITFGDKSRGKVVSRGTIRVNDALFSRMLLWSRICISICFQFCNSLTMTKKCALKRACLKFWMPVGILFARFPLLVEFSVLFFHILLALLDVCWQDLPLLFGSGIGGVVHWCHTRFWKANRMRTMYVQGSETHIHSDYIVGHHHTLLKVNSGKVLYYNKMSKTSTESIT
jgi:hypothetical protein